MKIAVFQVVTNGQDGRDKTKVSFSSKDEIDRDAFFNGLGNNKNYYTKVDTVLDLKVLGRQLINKLDGNDKMILAMCLCFDSESDSLQTSYFDTNITCYEPKK